MTFRPVAAATAFAALVLSLSSPARAQFETRASFPYQGGDPYSLVVGDFNGDGILDLAEVRNLPSGSVEILLGNGDGTFRPGDTYAVDVLFYGAAASLRSNGILDLVLGGGER